ncbi:uncharacterized protein DS421_4g126560 [Arachis hypogaea]|nr:uncharacterized protein DS421_4g126560 [Arachis hypogaea]
MGEQRGREIGEGEEQREELHRHHQPWARRRRREKEANARREGGSSRGSCRCRSGVRRGRWSPHHRRTCRCRQGEARRRQLCRVSAAEPVLATATGSVNRERARETVTELLSPSRCWARRRPACAAVALPELLAAAVGGGNRLPSLCLLVIRSLLVSLPPYDLPPEGSTTASSVLVFESALPFFSFNPNSAISEYVTPLSLLYCHFIPLL